MKTKTIKERAKKYASKKGDISLSPVYNKALASIYEEAYIAGASEQKAIDIEKACNWMKEQVYQEYSGGLLERLIPDTRIEEFRKAMKE